MAASSGVAPVGCCKGSAEGEGGSGRTLEYLSFEDCIAEHMRHMRSVPRSPRFFTQGRAVGVIAKQVKSGLTGLEKVGRIGFLRLRLLPRRILFRPLAGIRPAEER